MTLWIVLTALTSFAAILVAAPFIRKLDGVDKSTAQSIEVYRDQMKELEKEKEDGILDDASAKLAQTEIERRVLAISSEEKENGFSFSPKVQFAAVAVVSSFVSVGATMLYTMTGEPELPAAPFAAQMAQTATPAADELQRRLALPETNGGARAILASNTSDVGSADQLVKDLAARLEKNPDDEKGWRMLGWSYFNTKRYTKAADAYAKAVALNSEDADLQSAYGETLVRAADGFVSTKANAIFDKTLELNPKDARARFFKGMKLEQDGDQKAALKLWKEILADAPKDAYWIDGLRKRVDELQVSTTGVPNLLAPMAGKSVDKAETKVQPNQVAEGKITKGPTKEDIKAAGEMTPKDRQAMIKGMVDRLAARLEDNPKDMEGWIKLMRSRLVMGDKDEALAVSKKAAKIFANEPMQLAQITEAAKKLGLNVN